MEEIKHFKELIDKCKKCKLKECVSCEYTYTDMMKLENILNRLEQDERVISRLKADYEKEVSLYNSKEQLKCNTEVMRYLEEVLYE